MKNKNLSLILILIGLAALCGLGSGCAATSSYAEENYKTNLGYESFYDLKGEYKLVGKNNDIYLEKIDGSESRQITHTPQVKEASSAFSSEGNYIIIMEEYENPHDRKNPLQKFFLIKKESNDSTKKEISPDEAVHIITGK